MENLERFAGEVVLTGDRPTGPLHLGHFVGSLQMRVALQNIVSRQFILVADGQALTDNAGNPAKVIDNVTEVIADYLAVGLDPRKSTIFIQTQVPEIPELTMYYMNLVSMARVGRNPTVKTEMKAKGFSGDGDTSSEGESSGSVPVGFFCYPVNQAADITALGGTLVPVGPDQIPMIELTNDIVDAFNRTYPYPGSVLKRCQHFVPEVGTLPGTDGNAKMGKSLGNAIALGEPTESLRQKVMGMYTDPNHLRVEDPGNVEGNPVFTYLRAFDPDQDGLRELEAHYTRGGLGDVAVKKRLLTVLEEFITPIRGRREEFISDRGELLRIASEGTAAAREQAANTLSAVKRAMGINYW